MGRRSWFDNIFSAMLLSNSMFQAKKCQNRSKVKISSQADGLMAQEQDPFSAATGASQSSMKRRDFLAFIVLNTSTAFFVSCSKQQRSESEIQRGLISQIENVRSAPGYRYDTQDNQGIGMDHLKIIQISARHYVGVYHHDVQGEWQARVATSTDLLHWDYQATIDTKASQVYIQRTPDNGFLVPYEMSDPQGNYVKIRYYKDVDALLTAIPQHEVTIPKTLAAPDASEGTPTITALQWQRDIFHSKITLGLHANNGNVDLPAIGILTNFTAWQGKIDENRIRLFRKLGHIHGNIGARDDFTYQGERYAIQEAQDIEGNFSTWSPYLYSYRNNSITPLQIMTHRFSESFGNPTFTILTLPNGKGGFVTTQFIFKEGAAYGEAGELVYFAELKSS
jgi:hypothetical protein